MPVGLWSWTSSVHISPGKHFPLHTPPASRVYLCPSVAASFVGYCVRVSGKDQDLELQLLMFTKHIIIILGPGL